MVKQYTTRYASEVARGGQTSWQTLDNVTADVIEENGTEKYKNILVNGQPPRVDVEKTGSWSRGEFSSLQLDVLSPYTNANFHGKQSTTIVNRAAFLYDFSVEQPNSHWHVESKDQSYLPAYSGSIWIDKENYRVLRIELSATKPTEHVSTRHSGIGGRLRLCVNRRGQVSAATPLRGAELRARHKPVQPERDRVPKLQEVHGRQQHHVQSR